MATISDPPPPGELRSAIALPQLSSPKALPPTDSERGSQDARVVTLQGNRHWEPAEREALMGLPLPDSHPLQDARRAYF